MDSKVFSTDKHGDNNAPSDVVFSKGIHKITFAPRSTGYHIDSVQVIKKGGSTKAAELDKTPVSVADKETPGVESKILDTIEVGIAAKHDDFESNKAGASADLEFGRDGKGEQSVGLRFEGIALDKEADIKAAYFVFEAAETSKGAAKFEIEIEDTTSAKTYSKADGPDARAYLDEDVDWNPGAWQEGKTYKSADIADLIEAVIKEGGLDALDALAFRISGSGERVAEAFEGDGAGARSSSSSSPEAGAPTTRGNPERAHTRALRALCIRAAQAQRDLSPLSGRPPIFSPRRYGA